MNRIDNLFKHKDDHILSVYFTAGYPHLSDTNLIINGLEKAGADLIEIGFPFSDPVADGPVIQASSHQALENGMNLDILFDQLREIKKNSTIPKIMMGYFNTVYQFGIERFIDECVACGIDGVIIPDLPPEVYEKEYQKLFNQAKIHFICLVAPKTSPERIKYLISVGSGFVYLLSSSSTTGSAIDAGLSVLPKIEGLSTLIGFGIHDHDSFEMACKQANGAIIGTAFIRYLNTKLKRTGIAKREKKVDKVCQEFVDGII